MSSEETYKNHTIFYHDESDISKRYWIWANDSGDICNTQLVGFAWSVQAAKDEIDYRCALRINQAKVITPRILAELGGEQQ